MNQWSNVDVGYVGPWPSRESGAGLFSASEADMIRRVSSLQHWRRGNIVYAEGDRAECVFFVMAGVIRISRCVGNGQRQILALRVPGDMFGLPDDGNYANSADAACPARTLRLPWQRLQQMMRDEPQIQSKVLAKVMHNFRQAQARIMSLGQQNACQRLASFLLDFVRVPDYFDAETSLLQLPVSRSDLGDYLGTVRQSTVRAFAQLEIQGLIRRVDSHSVEILDLCGLELLQTGPRRCAPQQGHGQPLQESCVH
jgi:CRP-like cAMP-binding protein